jgi:hypothetical protein
MPLDVNNPPIAAYEAVQSVVSELAGKSEFRTPALRRADPRSLALSTPHRIATLPLDRLRQAKDLRGSTEIRGWRFLIHDGDRVIASTDAIVGQNGGFEFGQINEGPFNEGMEQAIRKAEGLPAVQRDHFEPVVLVVPALYIVALWLESLGNNADLILPLSPTPGELRALEPIKVEDFLSVARRLAERVPTDSSRPGDKSGG